MTGGQVVHLDAAGAARMSPASVAAQTAFLAEEGRLGAYTAQAAAGDVLRTARATLADLLGPGPRAEDVVFGHSASDAFATLLHAWPLRAGARIGVVPSEYGSNQLLLASLAARIGATLHDLPVDADGIIDLDALDRDGLPAATAGGRGVGGGGGGGGGGGLEHLDLVVFPQVPSQRGIVQPAAALGRRCAAAGVGLVVDVAQSAGQLDTTGIGADAYVGTSRKWLRGPRGAGFIALRPGLADRLGIGVPSLYSAESVAGTAPRPLPGIARISVGEASVTAHIGLAAALADLVDAGPHQVFARVAALAAQGRRILAGAGGFQVREPADTASAIITLRPPPGLDPFAVRDRLLREHGVLTSAIPTVRARELRGPLLRASAHSYNTASDFERLAEALAALVA